MIFEWVPVEIIEIRNWTIPLTEVGVIAKFVFTDPIQGFYVMLDKDNVVKIRDIDFDPKEHVWR